MDTGLPDECGPEGARNRIESEIADYPRILVIEDDLVLNGAIQQTLEHGEFEIASAADGEAGLAIFAEICPDLVICDLVMPRKNGVDAIREMRRSRPDVKIIAISGGPRVNDGPTLEDAREAGADDTMDKPLGARELLRRVKELLGADEV